ncbi:hypothetical protein J6590_034425 [Homalodisca vitripennis]|nr:hypothetical protein J6590_034425 [Homalodisca vitripennis]
MNSVQAGASIQASAPFPEVFVDRPLFPRETNGRPSLVLHEIKAGRGSSGKVSTVKKIMMTAS